MKQERGFALVLVIALLGLLVLLCYALAALAKVDSQLAGTAVYQTQARQNALLGLNVAIGELQRHAGADDRITGMAGITGAPGGANGRARHWCGVWTGTGAFLSWLASGAVDATIPNLTGTNAIALVSTGSLSSDVTNREHVWVVRSPVSVAGGDGTSLVLGNYAYWAGDEGVKLSLSVPDGDAVVAGTKHAITRHFTSIQPTDANLLKLQAYEQLTLPVFTTTALQPPGGFHSYTRAHYGLVAGVPKAGVLNVNSAGSRYWEGVAATYNQLKPGGTGSITPATFGNASNMSAPALWSGASSGKMAAGPFISIDGFLNNSRVISAITTGATLLNFRITMQDWLAVRSDTFRIRAYGDAVNPADSARVEAKAYCEAIVQRTPEALPGFGRRFVITYFRWLGPDDI